MDLIRRLSCRMSLAARRELPVEVSARGRRRRGVPPHRRVRSIQSGGLLGLIALVWIAATAPVGSQVPTGFQDTVVWSGLTVPTAVRFAPDGHVFVAEKSGVIKVMDDVTDATPTVFADLSTQVQDFTDRGLLSIAIDPGFPVRPYVYAFFAVDAPPGTAPPFYNDFCDEEDCWAFSRLVRLTAAGNVAVNQQTIREDQWCQWLRTVRPVIWRSAPTDICMSVTATPAQPPSSTSVKSTVAVILLCKVGP